MGEPFVADGTPQRPMEAELWAAGLALSDAKFAARMLRDQGYYLVRPDDLGWDDIRAFETEINKGQSVEEAAGGYLLRGIRALLRLPQRYPDREVVTYRAAAQALLANHEGTLA